MALSGPWRLKKMASLEEIGTWAFILGVVIAVLAGLAVSFTAVNATIIAYVVGALVVLGLIVGFLNVTDKETNKFLIASVSLVIVSGLGSGLLSQVQYIGPSLGNILGNILTFVVPSVVVVALKAIHDIASAK